MRRIVLAVIIIASAIGLLVITVYAGISSASAQEAKEAGSKDSPAGDGPEDSEEDK